MNIITSHFDNIVFFYVLISGGLSLNNINNNILFYNHKNKNPGLKTSFYSNLETGLKPVLFSNGVPYNFDFGLPSSPFA